MDMSDKTVLVTGATSGIGFAAASQLASMGARVILVGRNETKGDLAKKKILSSTPQAVLRFFRADLSYQQDIKILVEQLISSEPKLDILINNAGAFFQTRQESKEGLEMTFALNHMGYFVLTNGLLDMLETSVDSRIINVASNAHFGAALDFADLQMEKKYRGWKAYQRSKLANILFTNELARRLKPKKVSVNALHPGFVRTNFGNNNSFVFRWGMRVAMFLKAISVEKGAETLVYLASDPSLDGVSGTYFANCKKISSSTEARENVASERLWRKSEELTLRP